MNVDSWLVDTVLVSSVTGSTSYGDPTFGPQRSIRCRLVSARTTVTRPDGSETDSGHRVYTTSPVGLSDHLWLPGTNPADPDAAKTPVAVESSHDRAGRYTLYKVLL